MSKITKEERAMVGLGDKDETEKYKGKQPVNSESEQERDDAEDWASWPHNEDAEELMILRNENAFCMNYIADLEKQIEELKNEKKERDEKNKQDEEISKKRRLEEEEDISRKRRRLEEMEKENMNLRAEIQSWKRKEMQRKEEEKEKIRKEEEDQENRRKDLEREKRREELDEDKRRKEEENMKRLNEEEQFVSPSDCNIDFNFPGSEGLGYSLDLTQAIKDLNKDRVSDQPTSGFEKHEVIQMQEVERKKTGDIVRGSIERAVKERQRSERDRENSDFVYQKATKKIGKGTNQPEDKEASSTQDVFEIPAVEPKNNVDKLADITKSFLFQRLERTKRDVLNKFFNQASKR